MRYKRYNRTEIVLLPNLAEPRPTYRRRPRPRKKRTNPVSSNTQRIDAATLAATLQLQEQQRELIYTCIALSMKLGLLVLGTSSLIKLGVASHQRIVRYSELSAVLDVESVKLLRYQERFDHLFTIGGEKRLMDENDQWIAPNRIRVIWR